MREPTKISDTLTWTKGKHTFKFGGDCRYLVSLFTQVFNNYHMGDYTRSMAPRYPASLTRPIAYRCFDCRLSSAIRTHQSATVINPATDAYSNHFAFFAQDDLKISQSFTLNYGLRWEYHPGFL